jgi:hypothetical protein
VKALTLDQRAHGHQHGRIRVQAEPLPRNLPVDAMKLVHVDAISHHHDPVSGHPSAIAWRLSSRTPKDTGGVLQRSDDSTPAAGIAGQGHFRAAQGNAHRDVQPTAQQRGRIPFRIREMGIDHREPEGSLQTQHGRQAAQRQKEAVEPLECAGHRKKPWPPNLDAFLYFRRVHTRAEVRLPAPQKPLEREPRSRRNHRPRQRARNAEHAFADEQSRRRLAGVRKQRGQDHDARLRFSHRRHWSRR